MIRHVGNPPDRHLHPHLPQARLGILEGIHRRGKLGHLAGQRRGAAVAHPQQHQAVVTSFPLVGAGLAATPVAGHQFHLQPSQKLNRDGAIAEVLHLLGRGFGQIPLLFMHRRTGQSTLQFQGGGSVWSRSVRSFPSRSLRASSAALVAVPPAVSHRSKSAFVSCNRRSISAILLLAFESSSVR